MTTQTIERPTVNRAVIKLALAHLKRLKRRRAEYEEECREWARQGYRPHYCIHGTNQWTGWDNICGPCEDSLTDREIALSLAHNDWHEWMQRMELVQRASKAHVPDHIRTALVDWSLDALKILEEK